MGKTQMTKQRDMMRHLVKQYGRDKEKICRAYAAADLISFAGMRYRSDIARA